MQNLQQKVVPYSDGVERWSSMEVIANQKSLIIPLERKILWEVSTKTGIVPIEKKKSL